MIHTIEPLNSLKRSNNADGQVAVLVNLANFYSSECPLSLAIEKLGEIKKLESRITWPELIPLVDGLKARLEPPSPMSFVPKVKPETISDDHSLEWQHSYERLESDLAKSNQGLISIRIGKEIFFD